MRQQATGAYRSQPFREAGAPCGSSVRHEGHSPESSPKAWLLREHLSTLVMPGWGERVNQAAPRRAEDQPTNGDARKVGAAHINIINTSRHPAIRPRLPLFYSPLLHRLLFVLAFAYPVTVFYLYITWSSVMAAPQPRHSSARPHAPH